MHRHEYRRLTFSEVNTTVFFPRAAGDADYSYSLKDYFDLEPKDDLPPVTVITRVGTTPSGQILVRGVTSDNYDVKQVFVNGQPVSSTRENFQDWEVVLPGSDSGYLQLITSAEDANGNKELMPHRVNYYHDTVSARNLVSEKQD